MSQQSWMKNRWTKCHTLWDKILQCDGLSHCDKPFKFTKGGRPQFNSATPHYCGQPNQLRSCGLKKRLRACDCGPSKFDFRNSTTLRSLLPIPLLSSPFSSAQDGLKNQRTIFFELSVSLKNNNLP
jgi:hypothetical protein